MSGNFDLIKAFLSGRHPVNRIEDVVEKDEYIQFRVLNTGTEKLFTIHYRDSDSAQDNLSLERPMYHHYYLQFEMDNYPEGGRFISIFEWKWYRTEEDVLYRIRTLIQRYRR